jgi:type III secretion system FlhB-like substrate exporter
MMNEETKNLIRNAASAVRFESLKASGNGFYRAAIKLASVADNLERVLNNKKAEPVGGVGLTKTSMLEALVDESKARGRAAEKLAEENLLLRDFLNDLDANNAIPAEFYDTFSEIMNGK